MRYAEVAVHVPVSKTFTYHIPHELAPQLEAGSLVRVEFGVAMQPGVVVACHDSTAIPETKPILELLDPKPVMSAEYIDLAHWLSETRLAPIGACVWLMLPPGFTGKSDRRYHLLAADINSENPLRQALTSHLRGKGPQRLQQLKAAFRKQDIERELLDMEAAGQVGWESVLSPPPAKEKTAKRIYPQFAADDLAALVEQAGRAVKRADLLEVIARHEGPPLTVREALDLADVKSRSPLNKLIAQGLIELRDERVWRDSLQDLDFVPRKPPKLTADQQTVWNVIQQAQKTAETARFLLHGVTGSGKTEIYLRAIAAALGRGQQAIFLVPEIALTPQTIRRVSERFPQQVAIVHGSLPPGERYDTWQRARAGDIGVVVGTRSALFTPLPNLGLIILDEEHDHSYKQAPPMTEPYYHAREAAEYLMTRKQGLLILGSATPDLHSWRRAQKGHLTCLHLPNRIMGHRQRIRQQAKRVGVTARYEEESEDAVHIDLPPVSVVDMRQELRQGNVSMFSRELKQGLQEALARGEQAMLLLNRRGQASYVFCRDCGYVMDCPRCDSPMTYHRHDQLMRCHHCGARQAAPRVCPVCQSKRIRYFGAGTQQVDEALGKLFPQARRLRWDIDTASKPQMHYSILQQFIDRQADILIGTQMIAKGLDLPLVTLVGVVSADLGLALPDYRAGERVFQLLTQVAGRAGRGVLGGKVVLQTYQPEHYVVKAAARHDYAGFVDKENAYRREMGYPPFRRLARIVFSYTDPYKAQKQANIGAYRLRQLLQKHELSGTSLIGPAPCFFTRIDRHYRWHLLLRGPNPAVALRDLKTEPGWQIDLDPIEVL